MGRLPRSLQSRARSRISLAPVSQLQREKKGTACSLMHCGRSQPQQRCALNFIRAEKVHAKTRLGTKHINFKLITLGSEGVKVNVPCPPRSDVGFLFSFFTGDYFEFHIFKVENAELQKRSFVSRQALFECRSEATQTERDHKQWKFQFLDLSNNVSWRQFRMCPI